MARSVTVIPARSQKVRTGHKAVQEKKIRVAAYCRVSTDQEDQLHSFEAQVEYYTKYINEHENYEMAGIYADEGISGTNTKKREQFKKMIADCEDGKIDLVITKSISRFARNTQDCLAYSRKLKNLGIGIIFEKENINTLDSTGELLFTILSSLAQDESRNISENCKWGIRTKFKNGEMHLNTFKFLGYDKDENGKLVINKEQAKTVRRIYRDFLIGINPAQIAKELTEEKVPGCLGQTKWYPSTVIGILKQEKHMGDALLQKTYTADFLTKRQVRNNGEIAQVYVKDSHKGIIDKQTWNAVQEEFDRREKFMESHGTDRYSYGADCMPFCEKVFCGECKSLFTRHSWSSRGIVQWQCKNHRKDGKVACTNAYGDAIKDDVFKEKLGRISIKELARTAKDRRSGSLGFAEAILIYYNKKSRNPLTWDKLYTHKLPHKKDMEEEPSDIPEPGDADGESSQMELFGLHDSGVSG